MADISATEADRSRVAYIAKTTKIIAESRRTGKRAEFDQEELALFRKCIEEKKRLSDDQIGRAVVAAKGSRATMESLWGLRSSYYGTVIERIQLLQEQTGD